MSDSVTDPAMQAPKSVQRSPLPSRGGRLARPLLTFKMRAFTSLATRRFQDVLPRGIYDRLGFLFLFRRFQESRRFLDPVIPLRRPVQRAGPGHGVAGEGFTCDAETSVDCLVVVATPCKRDRGGSKFQTRSE